MGGIATLQSLFDRFLIQIKKSTRPLTYIKIERIGQG